MKQLRKRRKEFEDVRSNKPFLILADAQPEYQHDCGNSPTQKICSDLDGRIRCAVGVRGRWVSMPVSGGERSHGRGRESSENATSKGLTVMPPLI
jgi:hypothetical protein